MASSGGDLRFGTTKGTLCSALIGVLHIACMSSGGLPLSLLAVRMYTKLLAG